MDSFSVVCVSIFVLFHINVLVIKVNGQWISIPNPRSLVRTMYGINPFTAIPTVDFGQIPFSIIYNVPQGLFIFAYLLILAAWYVNVQVS